MPSAASVAGGLCECVEGPCTCDGDAEARAAVPEERAYGADPEAWLRQTFPELRPPLSAALARASISHWQDLSDKAARAAAVDGPSFLNVLSTCQLGWRHEPGEAVSVARLAVETRFWPLYEVVDGRYRITESPLQTRPIQDWLAAQGRFRHLLAPDRRDRVREIQAHIDREWQALRERCTADAGSLGPEEAVA